MPHYLLLPRRMQTTRCDWAKLRSTYFVALYIIALFTCGEAVKSSNKKKIKNATKENWAAKLLVTTDLLDSHDHRCILPMHVGASRCDLSSVKLARLRLKVLSYSTYRRSRCCLLYLNDDVLVIINNGPLQRKGHACKQTKSSTGIRGVSMLHWRTLWRRHNHQRLLYCDTIT